MQTYSYSDLSCARDIISAPHLYPVSFHSWANKVNCFFNSLYDLIRLYHKRLRDWQMSIKLAWQDIKSSDRKTSYAVYKEKQREIHRAPREFRLDTGEYCRDRYPEKQAQKSRAYKSRMRMNYMNKANKLQTI